MTPRDSAIKLAEERLAGKTTSIHKVDIICRAFLDEVRRTEKLEIIALAAEDLYNKMAAHYGHTFDAVKVDWPEFIVLKRAFDALEDKK